MMNIAKNNSFIKSKSVSPLLTNVTALKSLTNNEAINGRENKSIKKPKNKNLFQLFFKTNPNSFLLFIGSKSIVKSLSENDFFIFAMILQLL